MSIFKGLNKSNQDLLCQRGMFQRGCYGLVGLSIVLSTPSGTAQDSSGLVFSQSPSIRSDPFRAMGLTEVLNILQWDTFGVLSRVFIGLSVATLVTCTLFYILLKCEQAYIEVANYAHRKGESMVAVFEESLAEDLINEGIEEQLDEVKLQLERAFHNQNLWESINKELTKVQDVLKEGPSNKNRLLLPKQFNQAASKILELIGLYQKCLSEDTRKKLEALAASLKESARLIKAVCSTPKEILCTSNKNTFKKWAEGLEATAEILENLDPSKIKSDGSLKKGLISLRHVAINALEVAKQAKSDDRQKNSYRNRIIYAGSFMIQQIHEIELEISQRLLVGMESLDDLLEKSKKRVDLLGWAENEEEVEKLIAEEEEKDRKDSATLDYLNRMLTSN